LAPEDGTDLFATGLLNSLFAVQLVEQLEAAFGLAFGDAELRLEHFRTVESMARLVQAKLAEAAT
jgi:methoxymalonate biosynthesis acyl carrier protein